LHVINKWTIVGPYNKYDFEQFEDMVFLQEGRRFLSLSPTYFFSPLLILPMPKISENIL
jgi:hypothetical protein